jgi:hypothetical protein
MLLQQQQLKEEKNSLDARCEVKSNIHPVEYIFRGLDIPLYTGVMMISHLLS